MAEASDKPRDDVPPDAGEGVLPFSKNCRAKLIRTSTAVLECLVPPPQNCGHALKFGNAYFCFHPNRWKIAARTLALEKHPS
jgi:hypothetical protein